MIEIDSVAVTKQGGVTLVYLENQEEGVSHVVHADAIAAWSELLGYADPAEALEAIFEVREGQLEPEPDEDGGDNVWTDAFILLQHREQQREEEFERAVKEGKRDDPRSPRLRSTLAAYRAVHEPVDGGECVMDRCRREARASMRLPDPSARCGSDSRNRPQKASTRRRMQEGESNNRTKIREAVAQCEEEVARFVPVFLHSVSGNPGADPMVEPEPEPEPVDVVKSVFHKYGGAQ